MPELPAAPSPSSSPISREYRALGAGSGGHAARSIGSWPSCRASSPPTTGSSTRRSAMAPRPPLPRRRTRCARLWPANARSWPRTGASSGPLRVRMALHAGEADPDAHGDYLAAPLNRLARLLATGHGGQILLSQTVQQLTRGALPAGPSCGTSASTGCAICWSRSGSISCCTRTCRPTSRPSRRSSIGRNNLPLQPTPFLGREREVEEIGTSCCRPDVRLVTLTGPGGVGKTRLGTGSPPRHSRRSPMASSWSIWRALTDPALVPSATATALGTARAAGAALLEETLADYLRRTASAAAVRQLRARPAGCTARG